MMVTRAYENHVLSGGRYLPYDVKQRLAAMYQNYTSSVAP